MSALVSIGTTRMHRRTGSSIELRRRRLKMSSSMSRWLFAAMSVTRNVRKDITPLGKRVMGGGCLLRSLSAGTRSE